MRYPIALIHEENGPDAAAVIAQLLNDAYSDGLHGADGYPLRLDEELAAFAEYSGKSLDRIRKSRLLQPLIEWMNRAYNQGQQDAARGGVTE